MLGNMRIGTRLAVSFAAVVSVFLASLLLVGLSFTHLMQDIRQIKEETLPYILVVDEMDTSRAEVQQWLTDVSATHNRDGYKDAEEAAQRFQGGEDRRHGLADPGGRLDEELAAVPDRGVHRGGHGAQRKGKKAD